MPIQPHETPTPACPTRRAARRPGPPLRLVTTLMVALGGAACGAGGDGADAGRLAVSVDSVAGVPHVRSAGTPPRWRLDSAVVVADAGGRPFGALAGVAGDWKGGIYVADAAARRVFRYGPDGEFLGALGASGELRSVSGLAWVGGRLATLDSAAGRIALLAADGAGPTSFVRWVPAGGAGAMALEQTRPGEAYAISSAPEGGDGPAGRAFVRLIGTGAPDTLPEYRGQAVDGTTVTCSGPAGEISLAPPLAPRPFAARAPDQRTLVGSTGEYRLALLGPTGDTLLVIAREAPVVPVTDADWQDAEALWKRDRESSGSRACDEEPTIARPASRPAFRAVLWDDRGRLWVEAAAPGGGYRLDVFDAAGALVGELEAPVRDPAVAPAIRSGRLFWVAVGPDGARAVRVARILDDVAAADSAAAGR